MKAKETKVGLVTKRAGNSHSTGALLTAPMVVEIEAAI